MSVTEKLYEWTSSLPDWQQHLARQLLERPQLDGDAFDEALLAVLARHGAAPQGASPPELQAIRPQDFPDVPAEGRTPRLLRLGGLLGVAAIAEDQELSFEPEGLSIIYGPNAAGKSSYVRVLKRLCRTVDTDSPLFGNVFATADEVNAPQPSARVEARVGDEVRSQRTRLSDHEDLWLKPVSVFDARCAEIYATERNTVTYVPSALTLLARLAAAQDELRHEIAALIENLELEVPTFAEFSEPSKSRTIVQSLSADTNPDEVERLATLTHVQLERHTELQAAVAASHGRDIRADAAAARQQADQADEVISLVGEIKGALAEQAIEEIETLAQDAAQAAEAVRLAAKDFASEPVPGVGGDPWKRMWEAARTFWDDVYAPGAFPPSDRCPLCLQELRDGAAERLRHFEEHVKSNVEAAAHEATRRLDEALARLQPNAIEACRRGPFLAALGEINKDLQEEIKKFLSSAEQQMRAVQSAVDGKKGWGLPNLTVDPSGRLKQWGNTRRDHAVTMEALLDPEKEKALRAELAEIEGRLRLKARRDDVLGWIGKRRRIEALRRAHSALDTHKVTRVHRELAEETVTESLRLNLRRELAGLRCEHMPVELEARGSLGTTQVELHLAGSRGTRKLEEILSEGEQRALSLAFFLAEVGCAEHDGAIVLDDPVSSLDDERREYIARRLVQEAHKRQVIVFTHDLPFLFELESEAEKADIPFLHQSVWRLENIVGRVDDDAPFAALGLKKRVAKLTDEIQNWPKSEEFSSWNEAWNKICDVYRDMRLCWERAVEERLFARVVQRFQREVKTLNLKDVNLSKELLEAVEEGMTRCSEFVHDRPPAAGASLPGRKELAADLEKLRELEKNTRPS